MTTIQNKIDFAIVFTVDKANPNGDPLNGNRPRQDYDGHGEVSDVAIKRKLRNRLQDAGESILVQSDERRADGYRSIYDRVSGNEDVAPYFAKNNKAANKEELVEMFASKAWYDVRAFGQVFAFKGTDVSVGVRGPVSIHAATSISPVEITSMQITKSVNSTTNEKDPSKKTSDTMGMKHRVDFGVYLFCGSINPQLAERTGFSDEDSEKLKQAFITLFANDSSSARPDGSMEVNKVFWWEHNSKLGQFSSAKVHRSIKIKLNADDKIPNSIDDYTITVEQLEGLPVKEYDGL
ncbi:type I-C CRISPR-associated protein Cas7/Csd2 [Paenibacillus crassostreae]|uniref:Type I-C CRISPR-associated protein Cas7/Csd2 n=1 Tax=Paenibacillus crassostreae TaxID=1763538 RepID=A0A167CDW2_9BACL|nr:type I-C CRISPR-associated protein Cas7/Csd2 [Paenibacillus crassostreae]AOZ91810.1 type I-C CRISPR-associated protein Cas7/Csd2 [Paenibacillus crassostreae]OAB73085.1 type I-C CRISPR-associated protein Cas7/Csd2 [Paenibacillus crassostreae]